MKKIIVFIFVISMMVTLTGCGGEEPYDSGKTTVDGITFKWTIEKHDNYKDGRPAATVEVESNKDTHMLIQTGWVYGEQSNPFAFGGNGTLEPDNRRKSTSIATEDDARELIIKITVYNLDKTKSNIIERTVTF